MAAMDEATADVVLIKLAVDGRMDYSQWPELLPFVLARIERNAYEEFRAPQLPPLQARPTEQQRRAPQHRSDPLEVGDSSDTAPSSQENNKENANPPSIGATSSTLQASSSPAPPSSANTFVPPQDGQQQPEPSPPARTLHPDVAALLNEILSYIRSQFDRRPPHTIQRLAELVLRPRQQYRHLVPYLSALDRVVHVTSGADIYPLPPAVPDVGAMSRLANGVEGGGVGVPAPGGSRSLTINTAASAGGNPGSDEALGGALLTPIPWLQRRANGGGSSAGAGGSEDGSSDAGSPSPVSSGSSSGGASSAQQRQTTSPTGTGSGAGRKMDPQVRTESTETIEGPNGMGSIETVSISVNGIPSIGAGVPGRGVTQGELLRQEQRAGVIPLSQLARHGQPMQQQQQQQQQPQPDASDSTSEQQPDEDAPMTNAEETTQPTGDTPEDDEEEVPHARGPEEIGAADTGPQPAGAGPYVTSADGTIDMRGIDVEAAVGRRTNTVRSPEAEQVPRSPKREAEEPLESGEAKKVKEDKEGEGGGEDEISGASTDAAEGDVGVVPSAV
ncbi:hypothetical protein QBC47DRAFT_416192 [Echria macrotheca]|uniref:Uncharacterized protein n=1 Tax=Echria macrotheca TaxID=438768 RepID=A0AAJ0BAU6_9PEZI|nr:hypothetical protein QBC47DRAFT_416192 [Echria macrotheca]